MAPIEETVNGKTVTEENKLDKSPTVEKEEDFRRPVVLFPSNMPVRRTI